MEHKQKEIQQNTTDHVVYVAISTFVWGKRGLDIVRNYFKNVIVVTIPWPMSDEEEKRARAILKRQSYEYLISFWNGLYIRGEDFEKAKKGAINFHPSPPEHPGLGMFTFLRLFPDKRNFHGATVHEIDDKLDHGSIYWAERFEVPSKIYMTDVELVLKTGELTLQMLDKVCSVLKYGHPTSVLQQLPIQKWGTTQFTMRMEQEWLIHAGADDPVRELNCEDGRILFEYLGAPVDSMEKYAQRGHN